MPNATTPPLFHAIIFDHDGTLVDSEHIHCTCWNQVLAQFDQSLKFEDYCAQYNGLPTLESAARIKAGYQLAISKEELYAQKIGFLNEYLETQPFPALTGVIDTLVFLQQCDIPTAIASGANRHEVESSVARHQWQSFFRTVCTKQDVASSKPSPDVYLLAAERLSTPAQYCLAIEDSDTGFESATRAGMHCLRITATPQEPWEFRNMTEILAQLKRWQSEGTLVKQPT